MTVLRLFLLKVARKPRRMKTSMRIRLATILCIAMCGIPAATLAVEGTPIPRDPQPNFAPLRYLLGTWNCTVNSSRRSRSFPTTSVTRLSDDGYWMVTVTKTPPVPWNPIALVARDYMTYDSTRNIWVDLTMDDHGLYMVSTSKQHSGDSFVWDDDMYPKSHSTAVHFANTVRKVDDRTTESTQRFAEPSGRTFVVTTTCTRA